ncbi:DUF2971 domain-containing protein [Pseudomonas siliginis]|uniref:DUF2971 domain-containing protein n=1 Tax=Pseudomonas siliginis TaxID=2842346 RepID=UPI0020927FC9|nr:DUF2971 domain-containing protein [Pseudomonas siliginis]UST97732.1 DUF2971 domain-containing protein [Pseudomonas siliginis]
MKVEILKSLSEDMILWRYMSLDKFINLLDDKGIYFAPLKAYQNSDPFEGYPPSVALKAMYSLSEKTFLAAKNNLAMAEAIPKPWSPTVVEAIKELQEIVGSRKARFKGLIDSLFKGTLVSCWYYSEHQSEAMWKLYGDQGKGIAVRTTVGKLKQALQQAVGNSRQKTIFIGKVRYVDYADASITPADCNVDGHIIPLLKRISYSHENEVRAFLSPDIDTANIELFEIKPFMASCDVVDLIDGVYVSPYTSPPFIKAVQAVASAFGLRCPVEKSDLLSGEDALFNFD